MYPLGHAALGYFAAKATQKITKTEYNTILVWILSSLPDIDVIIPPLEHRGPTHSIITAITAFIPVLILLRKRALPYLASLASHTIGDVITAYGIQLYWPLSPQWIKVPCSMILQGRLLLLTEIGLFLTMIGYMYFIEPRENARKRTS
jgi:membrane-bound metal-dependent hydrolase YbcI (DUF457 family)